MDHDRGRSRGTPLAQRVPRTPRPGRVVGVDGVTVQEGWSRVAVHRHVAPRPVTPTATLGEGRVLSNVEGVQGNGLETRESSPEDTDVPPRDPEPGRRGVRDPIR